MFDPSRNFFVLLIVLSLLGSAVATSNVQYNIVLTIVIVELIFAFSIGIICIMFSVNLYRALKDSDGKVVDGNLPNSPIVTTRGSLTNRRSGATYAPVPNDAISNDNAVDDIEDCASDDYELETEARRDMHKRRSFGAALASFTAYVKPW